MIRIDRIEEMVIASIRALAPSGVTAVWARSLYPHRAGQSVVTAGIARGPRIHPVETETIDAPTVLRWSIVDLVEGERIGIGVTGARWAVDVEVGATVEATRNALLDLFGEVDGANALEGVTASADGDDAIVFDAGGIPGRLYNPTAIGSSVVAATTTIECEVGFASADFVVELQAYAGGGGSDAIGLLGAINGAMAMARAVSLRDALNVAYAGADEVVDLTSIAGAQWESRASTRWRVSTKSYVAHPADSVGEANLVATLYDGDTPSVVSIEITEP